MKVSRISERCKWPFWPIYLNHDFISFVERTINWNTNKFFHQFQETIWTFNHPFDKFQLCFNFFYLFDLKVMQKLKWNIENWDKTKWSEEEKANFCLDIILKISQFRDLFERHFDFNTNNSKRSTSEKCLCKSKCMVHTHHW